MRYWVVGTGRLILFLVAVNMIILAQTHDSEVAALFGGGFASLYVFTGMRES